MKKKTIKKSKVRVKKKPIYKKYVLKFLVIFGIVCLLIFGIFIIFSVNPIYVKEAGAPQYSPTPSPTPSYPKGKNNILTSSHFIKRNYKPNEKTTKRDNLLLNIPDNELIGIRCAPWIEFNKITGYTYYLNNEMFTLNDNHILSILNTVNSSAPKDGIISGYFVCQTEDKRIILNYSSYKNAQTQLDRTYRFMQLDSHDKLESITDIPLSGWSSCQTPLLLTKNNILYYQCDGGDGTAGHYWLYKIDINNKINQLLLQCDINTQDASSTCQQ